MYAIYFYGLRLSVRFRNEYWEKKIYRYGEFNKSTVILSFEGEL